MGPPKKKKAMFVATDLSFYEPNANVHPEDDLDLKEHMFFKQKLMQR